MGVKKEAERAEKELTVSLKVPPTHDRATDQPCRGEAFGKSDGQWER